jgi:hypothetical protein
MEIVSPLLADHPADVLSFHGFRYLALYTRYSMNGDPQPPELLAAKHEIINQVGAGGPFFADDFVSLYTMPHRDIANAPATLSIGAGWHEPEQEPGGRPFRWLKEGRGTLCVFSPRSVTNRRLSMEGTAFVSDRQLEIVTGSRRIFSGTVPVGQIAGILTEPMDLEAGMTEILITAPDPGVAPSTVDANAEDDRQLTVNFRNVRLLEE